MGVMNTGDQPATIDLSRFAERIKGFTKAYDVATGVTFNLEPKLTLGEKYLLVMEVERNSLNKNIPDRLLTPCSPIFR